MVWNELISAAKYYVGSILQEDVDLNVGLIWKTKLILQKNKLRAFFEKTGIQLQIV